MEELSSGRGVEDEAVFFLSSLLFQDAACLPSIYSVCDFQQCRVWFL